VEVIRAEFLRLTEMPAIGLFGLTGAYVIWDSRARGRPSYVGEGVLLTRLAEHASSARFATPLDGYVAITGRRDSARAKRDAEILEAVLLKVADHTDRLPTQNLAPGKLKSLDRLLRRHPTVRIRIQGFDPLGIPQQARPLARAKTAHCRYLHEERAVEIDHNWRLRRLQA
jgi:hypothetical protein